MVTSVDGCKTFDRRLSSNTLVYMISPVNRADDHSDMGNWEMPRNSVELAGMHESKLNQLRVEKN